MSHLKACLLLNFQRTFDYCLFIFKDKGSELLQCYLSSLIKVSPLLIKIPTQKQDLHNFFKLARVLHLNGVNSLILIHSFQKLTKIAKDIKLRFGHFKSFALSTNL